MSLSLEFNVSSKWRNRNGGGHIRNRTCEKNYGESTVKVNSTKCNGSDFEIISIEWLVILFKKTCLFMKTILNIELDFKSKHGASATLVIRNSNLPSNTACICRIYIEITTYCFFVVQIFQSTIDTAEHLVILVFRPATLLKRDSGTDLLLWILQNTFFIIHVRAAACFTNLFLSISTKPSISSIV